ncbi:MAG: hypothetical protein R3B58_13750 [Phycisphaerales bacterium]
MNHCSFKGRTRSSRFGRCGWGLCVLLMLNATVYAQQASLVFMDNLPPNLLSYEVGFLSLTDDGTVIGTSVEQSAPIGTGITWSQQKGWTLLPKPGPEWSVSAQGTSRDGRYIAGLAAPPELLARDADSVDRWRGTLCALRTA